MAFTTINNGSLFMNTKIYTGNQSSTHAVTGVGFKPDLTWLKNRSGSGSHYLYDAIRGVTKSISSDTTGAELTNSYFSSFDTDGFTLGSASNNVNGAYNYASWNWKAGTAVSGNTSGSGTYKTYTGSVNTTSGFSITKFVGNGTAGHTIPHNLGAVPKIIILKDLQDTTHWNVYTEATGNTRSLLLSDSGVGGTSSGYWNNTTPTSSVFTLGSDADLNGNDGNFIAYCFADVKGYSKFSSYVGNGSANGTFIYTGFSPAFVIVKATSMSGQNWQLNDNKRKTFNVNSTSLFPNLSNAESTDGMYIDMLSNGFKARETGNGTNGSGVSYIYMAFAEAPLVGTNNVPANAR